MKINPSELQPAAIVQFLVLPFQHPLHEVAVAQNPLIAPGMNPTTAEGLDRLPSTGTSYETPADQIRSSA